METAKNTYYEFNFEDGGSVKMSLAFYLLYQLKAKKKAVYDEYNRIMTKGMNEELDMISVLYAAYLCGNIADVAECMSFEDFMMRCGSDRFAIKKAVEVLTKAKKQ